MDQLYRELLKKVKIPVNIKYNGNLYFICREGQREGYYLASAETKQEYKDYCKRNNLKIVD